MTPGSLLDITQGHVWADQSIPEESALACITFVMTGVFAFLHFQTNHIKTVSCKIGQWSFMRCTQQPLWAGGVIDTFFGRLWASHLSDFPLHLIEILMTPTGLSDRLPDARVDHPTAMPRIRGGQPVQYQVLACLVEVVAVPANRCTQLAPSRSTVTATHMVSAEKVPAL